MDTAYVAENLLAFADRFPAALPGLALATVSGGLVSRREGPLPSPTTSAASSSALWGSQFGLHADAYLNASENGTERREGVGGRPESSSASSQPPSASGRLRNVSLRAMVQSGVSLFVAHDCADFASSHNASRAVRYDLYSLRQFMEYQQSMGGFQFGGGYGDMESAGVPASFSPVVLSVFC